MDEKSRMYAFPAKNREEGARLIMLIFPSKLSNHIKLLIFPCRDGSKETEKDLKD